MNAVPSETAPFYHDVADAPAGGKTHWARTRDGLRLRIGHWDEGAMGTVLLFSGRTEFLEKYGPAAAEFAARGFAMISIDWRGQGLSDRMIADPNGGYVGRFNDYQLDVATLLAEATRLNMPRPFYLVAHSMGGAIGLRALHDGLAVKAAAFSAPMWGIAMAPTLRPLAWSLSWASRGLGFDQIFAPGTSRDSYLNTSTFAENMLTSDSEVWAWMQAQVRTHPALVLGGPSLRWLYEALRDTRKLAQMAAPDLPTYAALGSAEKIVDVARIHARMSNWPKGRLDVIPGARHEVMMETPAIRKQFFDNACALFRANP